MAGIANPSTFLSDRGTPKQGVPLLKKSKVTHVSFVYKVGIKRGVYVIYIPVGD